MQKRQSVSQKMAYWLKVVSLGLVLGLGLQFTQAWTAPSALPPGGNVSGPVTTGAGAQYKLGRLGVNSNVAPINAFEVGGGGNALIGGNAYVSGNVGIGTAAPNRKLHVLFNNPNADGTNGQIVVENTADSVNGVASMNIRVSNPGATGGIQFSVGDWQGSPSKASFGYDHGDQEFQYWTSSGTWSPKLFIGQTGKLTSNDTVYASAFHDSANAGYRADPAGMSIFNTLATLGSITSSTSVTSPQFCIGASCINSWPSSGGDNLGNHTATQNLNMNTSNRIINLAAPTGNNDAATKGYVDGKIGSWAIFSNIPTGAVAAGCNQFHNVASSRYSAECWGGASVDIVTCGTTLTTSNCPAGTTRKGNMTSSVDGGFCDVRGAFSCIKN